ncbi:MAG TPA: RHS repeat protein, partial [Chloroflexi bacterium]|nr:RHS repeat protein [Chloroflexota bacterium]
EIDAATVSVPNGGCKDGPPNGSQGSETRYSRTRILNSITEYGYTRDTNGSVYPVSLPAVNFTYENKHHYFEPDRGTCFVYKYLSRVDNGYGGSTQFVYTHNNRVVGSYDYRAEMEIYYPDIGYNYYVTQVKNNDGFNEAVIDYAYWSVCYNQTDTGYGPKCQGEQAGAPRFGNIGGFEQVVVTTRAYDGSLVSRQVTKYNQNDPDIFGKAEYQDVGTPDLNNPLWIQSRLTRQETDYNKAPVANGGDGDPDNDVTFTYIEEVRSYQYHNGAGSPVLSSKTRYEYNQSDQGNAQYGNLTHIYEYDDANAPNNAPYRLTRRWYYPNTGAWIVNKLAAEAVYEGNSWNILSGAWYYYDGATSQSTPPAQGFVTRARQFQPISCSDAPGGGGAGCATARQTVDTTYTRDAYGNQKTITSYRDYGYRTFTGSWAQIQAGFPQQASATTTLTYDGTYNLYPVQTRVTGPGLTPQTTSFAVYGFNGVPLSGFQRQPGLLKSVTDPNGVTTKYEYDPFGRLHAVYDNYNNFSGFGDADPWNGNPLKRYRYWDNRWNFSGLSPFAWPGSLDAGLLPGSGEIQAQSAYITGNTLHQSLWRGNQGWDRSVPIANGVVQWNNASNWSGPISLSALPGSGSMQSQSTYVLGDNLKQAIWRGNQGWYRSVPIVNGVVQWSSAGAWGGPVALSGLPGNGDIQSQTAYILGGTLRQSFWRGGQGWYRSVPVVNNVVQWSSAGAWGGPVSLNDIPGNGNMQSQAVYILGNELKQGFWRGNKGYTRSVPIENGAPQWFQVAPFSITEQTRPGQYPDPELTGISTNYTLDNLTYYDGFGRVIQQRERYVEVDGSGKRDIVTLNNYTATGQVNCASSPFSITTAPYFVTDACTSKPHTATTYDALGRARFVTEPDGSRTEHRYSINNNLGPLRLHHNVINPNRQRMRFSYDSLNQLAQVTEFTGNCGGYWGYNCGAGDANWAEYAATKYEYDVSGNLTKVTDAANSVTTMSYDGFGRKTSMSDPDMGNWSYEYDPAGNLTRQMDANNNVLCFEYDGLNRLTRKGEGNTADPCAISNELAAYTYDTAQNGAGQLAQLTW